MPTNPEPVRLYYIQDNRKFIGNCVLWWKLDSLGYTAHLKDAGVFSQMEAYEICKDDSATMWLREEIDAIARLMVDHQYLPRSNYDRQPR